MCVRVAAVKIVRRRVHALNLSYNYSYVFSSFFTSTTRIKDLKAHSFRWWDTQICWLFVVGIRKGKINQKTTVLAVVEDERTQFRFDLNCTIIKVGLLNRIIVLLCAMSPYFLPSSLLASHNVAAYKFDEIYRYDMAHIRHNCPSSDSRRTRRSVSVSSVSKWKKLYN